jgi:hypothetical protein
MRAAPDVGETSACARSHDAMYRKPNAAFHFIPGFVYNTDSFANLHCQRAYFDKNVSLFLCRNVWIRLEEMNGKPGVVVHVALFRLLNTQRQLLSSTNTSCACADMYAHVLIYSVTYACNDIKRVKSYIPPKCPTLVDRSQCMMSRVSSTCLSGKEPSSLKPPLPAK